MSKTHISPCDCEHPRTHFIQGGRWGPPLGSNHVSVCRDCGQFIVTATKGAERIRVEFALSTPESVEAAGRYLEYLEAEGD